MRVAVPLYIHSLMLLISLFLSPFSTAQPLAMKIAYAEYEPYSFTDNGQVRGIEVDVLNEALGTRMQIPLQHSVLPWKRVQTYVRNGEIDAYVAVATPERLSYAFASEEAVTFGSVSVFMNQADPRLEETSSLSLEALKPYRIGVTAGSGWAKRNLNQHLIQPAYSTSSLADMLKMKRIDMIVENPYIFSYHLKQFADDDFTVREIPVAGQQLSLLLFINKSSTFADILPVFNATLRAMKEDGTLDRIHARYR
ncbi:substrate-binding periplasmic protein [Aliamphritea spongicola]|uniref:substrate-binding periplasmic protein n=1 Tax=Aliamphritea spongicola TaxID=707589 RepID=UPI00196AAE83|nr:transporter substrate-binding domain-containing protein [Aliamphritea spongicola]MBN3564223.1 transporter substrate-binding domain-containing protein [Aliamphritea spongicola]